MQFPNKMPLYREANPFCQVAKLPEICFQDFSACSLVDSLLLFLQELQQINKLIGNTTILIEIDSKQQIDKTVLVYWVVFTKCALQLSLFHRN